MCTSGAQALYSGKNANRHRFWTLTCNQKPCWQHGLASNHTLPAQYLGRKVMESPISHGSTRLANKAATERRWVTFGSKVNGLNAAVSFYEYAEDGHLLHKTPLDIKARLINISIWTQLSFLKSLLWQHVFRIPPGITSISWAPDAAKWRLVPVVLMHDFRGVQSGAFGFFHDLAVTENYYILLQNPTKLNFSKLLFGYVPGVYTLCEQSLAHIQDCGSSCTHAPPSCMASTSLKSKPFCAGRCSIAECIQYDGNLPCRVHLVPRPGSNLAPQVIAVNLLLPRRAYSTCHVGACQSVYSIFRL